MHDDWIFLLSSLVEKLPPSVQPLRRTNLASSHSWSTVALGSVVSIASLMEIGLGTWQAVVEF